MNTDILVGYRKVGAGIQTARGGITAELITTAAHGNGYDAAVGGRVMVASTGVAGVAPGTALSTTPPLCVWNPPGSGKLLSVLAVTMNYISGTLGAGTLVAGFNPSQATVPSTGTELTPQNAMLGAPRGVGRAFTGSTISATLALLNGLFSMGAALATTTQFMFPCAILLEGTAVITPGTLYGVQGVAAAGTSPLVILGIVWEECDY